MALIDNKKKYIAKETADLLKTDKSTIRVWRDMDVYNLEKTDVLGLKVKDNRIIHSKMLLLVFSAIVSTNLLFAHFPDLQLKMMALAYLLVFIISLISSAINSIKYKQELLKEKFKTNFDLKHLKILTVFETIGGYILLASIFLVESVILRILNILIFFVWPILFNYFILSREDRRLSLSKNISKVFQLTLISMLSIVLMIVAFGILISLMMLLIAMVS